MATDLKSDSALIFLVGATGVGKSGVALELARGMGESGGAAILAMDAMQVYRGANIGTSKPGAAERAEFPHGGLDLVDFASATGMPAAGSNERFDVAQYLKHAESFLREQREAGRRVLIVGGTGLYFRALTRGLCEAPQGSEELRAELNALSVEDLRERLKRIDPKMLERVDAANPRRLARAIEVKETSGRSLHEWQEETPEPLVTDFKAFWIERSKEELSQRIEARVEAMFAQGWVEEVRGLVAQYGAEAVRNFPGIGYREIVDSCGGQQVGERGDGTKGTNRTDGEGNGEAEAMELRGQGRSQTPAEGSRFGNEGKIASCSLREPGQQVVRATQEIKRDILVATRQYAKRQLTWFAREPNLRRVMLSGTQPLLADVVSLL